MMVLRIISSGEQRAAGQQGEAEQNQHDASNGQDKAGDAAAGFIAGGHDPILHRGIDY